MPWLANLVIDMTIERTHLGHHYADKQVGVMVIRGENVVLLGEIVRASFLSAIPFTLMCTNMNA